MEALAHLAAAAQQLNADDQKTANAAIGAGLKSVIGGELRG